MYSQGARRAKATLSENGTTHRILRVEEDGWDISTPEAHAEVGVRVQGLCCFCRSSCSLSLSSLAMPDPKVCEPYHEPDSVQWHSVFT